MDELLKIAFSQLREKEIEGQEDNFTIAKYAKESGFDWVGDDETPWGSIFENRVVKKAKLKQNKSGMALSWLRVGRNVDACPELGKIVVFLHDKLEFGKGHVGFFMGYSPDLDVCIVWEDIR